MKQSLFFLFLLLLQITVQAQTRSGRVLSADDSQPLPGATVKVKGTTNSAVTDQNGLFTISAVKGDVLVISFIGYQERELRVGDEGAALNVTLQPGDNSLNEVVVVGYGT